MNDDPISSIWKALTAIFKNLRSRLGIFSTIIVVTSSLLWISASSYGNMEWIWKAAGWVFENANTPWIGLFVLVINALILIVGIREVCIAQQNGSQVDKEILYRETQAQLKAVEIPNKLSSGFVELCTIVFLEEICLRLRGEVELYEHHIHQVESAPELRQMMWQFGEFMDLRLPGGFNERINNISRIIGIENYTTNIIEVDIMWVEGEPYTQMGRRMHPNSRIEFEAAGRHNVVKMNEAIDYMDKEINRRKQIIIDKAHAFIPRLNV